MFQVFQSVKQGLFVLLIDRSSARGGFKAVDEFAKCHWKERASIKWLWQPWAGNSVTTKREELKSCHCRSQGRFILRLGLTRVPPTSRRGTCCAGSPPLGSPCPTRSTAGFAGSDRRDALAARTGRSAMPCGKSHDSHLYFICPTRCFPPRRPRIKLSAATKSRDCLYASKCSACADPPGPARTLGSPGNLRCLRPYLFICTSFSVLLHSPRRTEINRWRTVGIFRWTRS